MEDENDFSKGCVRSEIKFH